MFADSSWRAVELDVPAFLPRVRLGHRAIEHCTPGGDCLGKRVWDAFSSPGGIDEDDPASLPVSVVSKSRSWDHSIRVPVTSDDKWKEMKVGTPQIEVPIPKVAVGRLEVYRLIRRLDGESLALVNEETPADSCSRSLG